MKDRIHQIMTLSGLNQSEFSTKTGLSAATLSNIFNGRTAPTLNHVNALRHTFPEINMQWLIFGEGEMMQPIDEEGNVPSLQTQARPNPAPESAISQTTLTKELIAEAATEAANIMNQTKRRVVEIRVFFDDGTYDVFMANKSPLQWCATPLVRW